jgi:hypothetical protein
MERAPALRPTTAFLLAVCLLTACVGPEPECTPLPCGYFAEATPSDPEPVRAEFEACACVTEEGELSILEPHLARLAFDDAGLATVWVGKKEVAYVHRSGKAAWVLPFDNGADYFVEGLARTVRGGKVGFLNQNLEVVIEPRWDFAFPFENGRAVVCQGCRPEPVGPDHEHSSVEGGKWGVIGKDGAVVVPVAYAREELLESPNPAT